MLSFLFILFIFTWLFVNAVCILCFCFAVYFRKVRFAKTRPKEKTSIAFFHPYCNDGGGGERVLWMAVKAVQEAEPQAVINIFTGEEEGVVPKDILSKVQTHFGVNLPEPSKINFIFLKKRHWVSAERYPHFTMLGQSLGSMVLGWEAISSLNPHILIDSMGYAFIYPIFKVLGGSRVVSYTHYPTISTDMLSKVQLRTSSHNNSATVSSSVVFSSMKILYYKMFAKLYGFVGSFTDEVMVNSSWTRSHIAAIWGKKREEENKSKALKSHLHTLYPPCDTTALCQLPLQSSSHDESGTGRPPIIISIGQFRPEKDHALQLRSFAAFLERSCDSHRLPPELKLVLIGSCRNDKDQERIDALKDLAKELNIQDRVLFEVNISYQARNKWLSLASIGLHTMWCEHFGIGVVEFMAAGVIPIAHNSGGPKLDIVVPFEQQATGFLAASEDEYAEAIERILYPANPTQIRDMRAIGRRSVITKFSDDTFVQEFKKVLCTVLSEKPKSQ